MTKMATIIKPHDQGRRMSLAQFNDAEAAEGHLYELSRGVITAVDVPGSRHLKQLDAAREQFYSYRRQHLGVIHAMAGGSDCKILLVETDSERHPDWAVYLSAAPVGPNLWASWVPEIVIEIVSPSSRHRDYQEKPQEYLRFGIAEYWIIDDERREMLVYQKSDGRYRPQVIRPGQLYSPTNLPGFEFDLVAVFDAARAAGR